MTNVGDAIAGRDIIHRSGAESMHEHVLDRIRG